MSDQEKKRRSKVKYPALTKKYNSRIRQEYLDQDYLDELSPEEMTWLNQFMEEYNNSSFKNDGSNIDNSAEGRKAAYDRTNARNRCLYGRLKLNNATDKVVDYEEVIHALDEQQVINNVEDSYIEYMEFRELKDWLKEYEAVMSEFTESDE